MTRLRATSFARSLADGRRRARAAHWRGALICANTGKNNASAAAAARLRFVKHRRHLPIPSVQCCCAGRMNNHSFRPFARPRAVATAAPKTEWPKARPKWPTACALPSASSCLSATACLARPTRRLATAAPERKAFCVLRRRRHRSSCVCERGELHHCSLQVRANSLAPQAPPPLHTETLASAGRR